MKRIIMTITGMVVVVSAASAATLHVAINGSDANPGTFSAPLRTIQRAADMAQPGDVVTVHEGIYRERVNPLRGGASDTQRITYQAAPGEQVVITGSEIVKHWERVTNDTWRLTLPNSFFGKFNPYADLIHGDWYGSRRPNHIGAVYLNGDWLREAAHFDEILQPAGQAPLWFAMVDGVTVAESVPEYLLNVVSLKPDDGPLVLAGRSAARHGTQLADCTEGGQCVGFIRPNDWLRYDAVDFGTGTESVTLLAAADAGAGGVVELRLDKADGELLGTCEVASTDGWQKWQSFTAHIKKTGGKKNLCLVFQPLKAAQPDERFRPVADGTVIYAQFPGVDPNTSKVEINVRQTGFTPDRPGINYLTVRGFDLRDAATPWAPPTAGQIGIISAYWCKGWVIENNKISYSTCCGIALGKYSDEFDNTSANSAEGYVGTLTRALTNGWNQATVGSHVVRNNEISHCEQTGIVGSLGCSFSTITGNDIHDIHVRDLFGGAEMGGIKFHGAIDVVIRHNHIYRCGDVAGIWLDWMAQNAQVTGNLMHDNTGGSGDIFFEMQHGPILVANNLLLSKRMSFSMNSQGIAFAHNLIAGPIVSDHGDTRVTPFHQPHSTALAGMYPAAHGDSGDDRFYNNLFVAPGNLQVLDDSALPCFAAGNVFTKGSQPSKFDTDALIEPDFNPGVNLAEKPDGWYLTISENKAWRDEARRSLVTTALLGRAKVSDGAYENADGSPVRIGTDYFGKKRNEKNPFPGPFEIFSAGTDTFKVWPVVSPAGSNKMRNDPASAGSRWPSATPKDCPFKTSGSLTGIEFTGRHAEYTHADTWYPSWASDGNLYSPWTDGSVNRLQSGSGGRNATTGFAEIIGDDPLHLTVTNQGVYASDPSPYTGRYPCGSLLFNGVWYYGTYCLYPEGSVKHEGKDYNWPWLGLFVGFRYSTDFGKTWTQTPCTPARPLFGETVVNGEPVKIGSPHFVDFGKNLEHSPDGKAYLVAHGAHDGVNRRFGYDSWITGDEIYLLRVTPGITHMNDASKYEFFAGRGFLGKPRWTRKLSEAKPIAGWRDSVGCVTMTYNAPLKKYLMCVTDGGNTAGYYNTYILESDRVTGPFKMVQYLHHFGEQGYFVNLPSKFISADGRTLWLCYAANFAPNWNGMKIQPNPPGSRYGMCLQESTLLTNQKMKGRQE